jgi:hypothetical protein
LITARKLIAIFCLSALLLAAVTPTASGLFCAIVVPLLLFIETLAVASFERRPEQTLAPQLLCLPVIASRAPPFDQSLI